MKFKLFNYFRSSASYRVRIALALKAVPYEYISVHLLNNGGEQKSAAHEARNPMKQVPALEVTDGNEQYILTQSVAICEWLDESITGPNLLPTAPLERAWARELVEIVNSGIQPHQNLSISQRLDAVQQGLGREHAQHFNVLGLEALDRRVRSMQKPNTKFIFGSQPTLAEAFFVPQLESARRFGVDVSPYKALLAVEAECLALEAFQKSQPSAQPDFSA